MNKAHALKAFVGFQEDLLRLTTPKLAAIQTFCDVMHLTPEDVAPLVSKQVKDLIVSEIKTERPCGVVARLKDAGDLETIERRQYKRELRKGHLYVRS